MKKFLSILLLCSSLPTFASVSKQQTQNLFNQLIRANNIQAQLHFTNSNEINAYGGTGHVSITKGMLLYANKDIMTYVLSHELAHATGHLSELEADKYSGRIGRIAGYNVCPGAEQFLLGIGLESGDGIHPTGDIRLKAMCK